MYFLILNGPNLNLLGKREPEIYGTETFEDTMKQLRGQFADVQLVYAQSNCEGELVTLVQQHGFDGQCAGIVFNPGAYAHYSYAIADAVAAIPAPVVEVHISNIHAREEFRATSVTARAAAAMITGCGRNGYALALQQLINLNNQR